MTVSRVPNVEGGIQPTIVTAKGDLITAVANANPARLGVGSDGQLLTADSSTATGLSYQSNFAAGKNKIINGDFFVNQRAFSTTTSNGVFTFDRFGTNAIDGTSTYTAQTFTLGSEPLAGSNAVNYIRLQSSGQTLTTALTSLGQKIENVRTFAGETVTMSFYAKASTGTPNITGFAAQNFGTGGSTTVNVGSTKKAITTSWAKYSFTINVPSITGKTVGANNHIRFDVAISAGTDRNAYTDSLGIQSVTIDIWGIQVEAGATATAFQTATGTIQGELAACQRYYYQLGYLDIAAAYAASTTGTTCIVRFPVQMRTAPTGITVSTVGDWRVYNQVGGFGNPTAITFNNGFTNGTLISATTTAGTPTLTAGSGGFLYGVNPTAVIGFTGAEL